MLMFLILFFLVLIELPNFYKYIFIALFFSFSEYIILFFLKVHNTWNKRLSSKYYLVWLPPHWCDYNFFSQYKPSLEYIFDGIGNNYLPIIYD